MQEGLAFRAQGVEPRGDQRLHRFRKQELGRIVHGPQVASSLQDPPVHQHPHELLRVQGISPRPLQEGMLGGRRQDGLVEERAHQPGRVLLPQRGQPQGCVGRGREGHCRMNPHRHRLGHGHSTIICH